MRAPATLAPATWSRDVVQRAELHGLADLVWDAWQKTGGSLEVDVVQSMLARRVAREIDHAAHLDMLARIDRACDAVGLRGVALKGPLFAERYYARPAARGTTDIDLLVRERDLEVAARALATVGYVASLADSEQRFRREHHHLHFHHDHAPALELHFHAYRGFGRILRSDDLVDRSVPAPRGYSAIRVLCVEDELVYLAVHAAAHRFGRLSWLHDLRLLLETMNAGQVEEAARRARTSGFAGPLALAGRLLISGCGVDEARVWPVIRPAQRRAMLASRVTTEPDAPLARSATRFVYSLLLCGSLSAAGRYASAASMSYARRHLGHET